MTLVFRIAAGMAALLPAAAFAQRVSLSVMAGDRRVDLSRDALPAAVGTPQRDLLGALRWRAAQPGLAWSEMQLQAGTGRIPVRAIVLKIDPRRFTFALQRATRANGITGAWTIDAADSLAAIALNAGQFRETGPWGWLVMNGEERNAPGRGPLTVAIAFDSAGRVRWIPPDDLPAARASPGIRTAFQSFPLLVFDGRIPTEARDRRLVDHDHRDARLLFGELADGTLLLVLTRFDVLGRVAERVPIGLTLPESVVLVSALGVRHAVMLDGGTSAQVLIRDDRASVTKWAGLRAVPVALLAFPRGN